MANTIGMLLSLSYAPINRFIEYLDKPTSFIEEKQFQHEVLTQSIILFKSEAQPRNSKKIIQYYKESINFLKLDTPENVTKKLKHLKK